MNAKLFFTSLASVGVTLMMAGPAQAQSLFGDLLFGPAHSQPGYVTACGPRGCGTGANYGYVPRTNGSGGVCNVPMYNSPTVCGPRGCWTPANGPRTADCLCGNGVCSPNCPNPACQTGRGCPGNVMPMAGGYPRYNGGDVAPSLPPRETYPNGYNTPRGYGSYRPSYYYDDLPARVAPPVYRAPRYEDGYYPGASRDRDIETTQIDRSRSRFDSGRSPFYP